MKTLIQLRKCFILGTLLTLSASISWSATIFTTSGVNVRSAPWGSVLTGVPKGTKVTRIGMRDNFSRVRLANGRTGWIHSKYLTKKPIQNADTEASSHCENCLDSELSNTIATASDNIRNAARFGQGPQCIADKLIQAARKVIKNKYGNRTRGRGDCAIAVRQALNTSKIWPGGGIGHAKQMLPGLKAMGFKNIIKSGMTPDNAPSGSILVYGGTKASGCRGLGNTYGHVEIKESNNSYLYDGKVNYHIQKAYKAKCRPLIGVMAMGSECKTCTSSLKKTCGV